ncbi:MAG: DUF551 domain-containing protein [Mogibacterium sp.]|nr:DUF551 domain-containing protein [Mogibacterium sp.]
MNRKEYDTPKGKAVFDYDGNGVGRITLECMDMLMDMVASSMWIPCSERLPEENGESYLTYQCADDNRYGWCQVLRYDDGWNCLNGDKSNEIKRVVAWMPLPEPWEGADDE